MWMHLCMCSCMFTQFKRGFFHCVLIALSHSLTDLFFMDHCVSTEFTLVSVPRTSRWCCFLGFPGIIPQESSVGILMHYVWYIFSSKQCGSGHNLIEKTVSKTLHTSPLGSGLLKQCLTTCPNYKEMEWTVLVENADFWVIRSLELEYLKRHLEKLFLSLFIC